MKEVIFLSDFHRVGVKPIRIHRFINAKSKKKKKKKT